ncbi:MAG TPA: hypothetical protein VGP44_05035 [Gemmatimonadales bacterium]|nr:hypothetical protein [Gemmatimonadales bacterium]
MPSINTWIVKFQNDNVDATNYQIVDFDIDYTIVGVPQSSNEQVAEILAYFGALSGGFATGTRLVEVGWRGPGSAGATPWPFPLTEYNAIRADPDAGPWALPAWTAYGTAMGSGNLAPLGTSISVSERTAQVGRTGRGRHFLPFTSANTVSAGGTVGTGRLALIDDAYATFLLGAGTTPLAATPAPGVVVSNRAKTTAYAITTVKAQPVFSNLESRRR